MTVSNRKLRSLILITCIPLMLILSLVIPAERRVRAEEAETASPASRSSTLLLSKIGPITALPDAMMTYTLRFTNTSALTATSVLVTDTLSVSVTYLSASPSPFISNGREHLWIVGDLGPGIFGTIVLTVATDADLVISTTLVNNAMISATTQLTAAFAAFTTTVTLADLSLHKQGLDSVLPGDAIVYTLTYSNLGTAPADNVVISDALPLNATWQSALPPPTFQSGLTATWSLSAPVLPGAGGRIVLTVTASGNFTNSQLFVNHAAIETSTPESTTLNNTSAYTTALAFADLALTASVLDFAAPGDLMTYTLEYSNVGSAPAANVYLTATMPQGVTVVDASPPPLTSSGQTVSWFVTSTLPVSASGLIVVTGTLPLTAISGMALVGNANISTVTPEAITGNNTTWFTSVVALADLAITKTGPSHVYPNSTIVYTLAYQNPGNSTAKGVVISDALPSGITFYSSRPNIDGPPGQWLTWTLPGGVAAHTSGTIVLTGTVGGQSLVDQQVLTNTAGISTTSVETHTINNVTNLTTTVTYYKLYLPAILKPWPPPDLSSSSMLVDPPWVNGGDFVTYTVYLTNTGNGPATASFTDTLPTDTFYTATAQSWSGTVADHSTTVLYFSYKLRETFKGIIINNATVLDGYGGSKLLSASNTSIVGNPRFETGDLSGWLFTSASQTTWPVTVTSTAGDVISPTYSAILGNPNAACIDTSITNDRSGILSQTVAIPATAQNVSLSVTIRYHTYDKRLNNGGLTDRFALNVISGTQSTPVWLFDNSGSTFGCNNLQVFNPPPQDISMNSYRGFSVTLQFVNLTWADGYWNTWTDLDNVLITVH